VEEADGLKGWAREMMLNGEMGKRKEP